MDTIIGTATLSPADTEALFALFKPSPQEAEQEMARIMETSRLSGMEVVHDITDAGYDWSPVYRYGTEGPIAWVCATGERSEGPVYPD